MRKTEKYRKPTKFPNFFSLKMSSSNQFFNESGLASASEKLIINLEFKCPGEIYVKHLSEHIILNPKKNYQLNFISAIHFMLIF